MAIERTFKSGGNRISEPGEYIVDITEVKTVKSKKDKPMCVIVFQTHDGKKINDYYTQGVVHQIAKLKKLKTVCGLKESDSADKLIGKSVGIAVGLGNPMEHGGHFMQIEGYDTPDKVEQSKADASFAAGADEENIPF